jgi:hypothetical protein
VGNYAINTAWYFSDDGHGGTLITDPPTDSGTATIANDTTLEITGASAQSVSFVNNGGNTGTLVLDDSAGFTGQISGFTGNTSISDAIDLKDLNFATAAETYTENSDRTGGTLTVNDGTHTAHIKFSGDYVLGNFIFASDAQGGILITDPPVNGGGSVTSSDSFRPNFVHDLIASNPVNEILTGTGVIDAFVFKPNFGHDTITNFKPGNDVIAIDHTVFEDIQHLLDATHDVGGHALIAADANNILHDMIKNGEFHFV